MKDAFTSSMALLRVDQSTAAGKGIKQVITNRCKEKKHTHTPTKSVHMCAGISTQPALSQSSITVLAETSAPHET